MSRALLLPFLLGCAIGGATGGDAPPSPAASVVVATPAAVEWPRIESVLPEASSGDRPILIEFFKPECRYCDQLHAQIWSEPRIAALLDQMTKTRVDISTPAGGALAARMSLTLFPAVLLVDSSGRILDRFDGLPDVESARAFLERAAPRRIPVPEQPLAWLDVADFAADAGAPKLAADTYRRVMDDPRTAPEYADSARLKRARSLERLGELAEAAATLETFTTTQAPISGSLRPALDLLIRVRRALGDREGESRARDAFARLFPALQPPA